MYWFGFITKQIVFIATKAYDLQENQNNNKSNNRAVKHELLTRKTADLLKDFL